MKMRRKKHNFRVKCSETNIRWHRQKNIEKNETRKNHRKICTIEEFFESFVFDDEMLFFSCTTRQTDPVNVHREFSRFSIFMVIRKLAVFQYLLLLCLSFISLFLSFVFFCNFANTQMMKSLNHRNRMFTFILQRVFFSAIFLLVFT